MSSPLKSIESYQGISQSEEVEGIVNNKTFSLFLTRLFHKISLIKKICEELEAVHKHGLVHGDFHPGNILNNKMFFGLLTEYCHITDLGLCRPVNEADRGKVYGILPYVAPEVLRGGKYIQASDIYSFAMVAYEVLTDSFPYYGVAHDEYLATKICQGLRPSLEDAQVPQLLKDLVRMCWETDPNDRPTASELREILNHLYEDSTNGTEFS